MKPSIKLRHIFLIPRRALFIFLKDGPSSLLERLRNKYHNQKTKRLYKKWISQYDVLSTEDHQKILEKIEQLPLKPLISILMPVYNVPETWLRKALQSVCNQLYPHWELCIADDCSTQTHVRKILEEYQRKDPRRIRVDFRTKNGHISIASNTALNLVSGEFCALMDHDDELPRHALYRIADKINQHPNADLIYSDEDKIDQNGERFDPHFKPDWNPDLFYSQNFINHLGVYRTSILKKLGGFRTSFEGSQDYDLALRFIEHTNPEKIIHIPEILYHWRSIPGSVAFSSEEKPYAGAAARKAIQSHFDRIGIQARSASGYGPYHRVKYNLPQALPLVSIVIRAQFNKDLLKETIEAILYKTDYFNTELIIVYDVDTSGDTLKYLEELKKNEQIKLVQCTVTSNNSAAFNLGAKYSQGSILTLLNTNIQIINSEWLAELVSHVIRKEIGIVGPKLISPNQQIRHAGIYLGLIDGITGYPYRGMNVNSPGYIGRAQLTQNFSAVTGACMLIRNDLFHKVGGLDEINLPDTYADIDLCLRIRKLGYLILWTPHSVLYDIEESLQNPNFSDNCFHLKQKLEFMKLRWSSLLTSDPYYNPNLTLMNHNMQLATPPRLNKPWKTIFTPKRYARF